MWRYSQSSGNLDDANETFVGRGYAGAGPGKNNPSMQFVVDTGPLPQGQYSINAPYDNPKTGEYTMDLIPNEWNDMGGRADFRIHGDRINEPPGFASEGCIVLARNLRELIWNSGDHSIAVVV